MNAAPVRIPSVPRENRKSLPSLPMAVIGALALAALLVWHSAQFYPFISDDALISLRYAKRLLAGQGLTWTGGAPVEGYSNLLWILLLTAAGGLGADLIDAARVLGTAALALIPLFMLLIRERSDRLSLAIMVVLLAFLPLDVTAATWAIGGLEMPLFALLLSGAALLLRRAHDRGFQTTRDVIPPALLLGLAAVTRPDGILFAVAFTLALTILRWYRGNATPIPRLALMLVIPFLFVAAQLVFRLSYYGDWLPNTARVKIAFTVERWIHGWTYLLSAFSAQQYLWIGILLALVVGLIRRELRDRAILLVIPLLLWLLYVVAVGGDYFPSFRFMMPAGVLGVLLLVDVVPAVLRRFSGRARMIAAVLGILLLLGLIYPRHFTRQHAAFDTIRAKDERWEWDGKILGEMLAAAFAREQPLIAVTAAGCIPYWSGLPAIDMFGLNDRHIARAAPPDFGRGFLGHELGDARYLLNRKPDMIILNVGVNTVNFLVYTDTMKSPAFRQKYIPVTIAPDAESKTRFAVWMRRDSPCVGIRKWADSVSIPGYFLQLDTMKISIDMPVNPSVLPAIAGREGKLVQRLPAGMQLGYDLPLEGFQDRRIAIRGRGCRHIRASLTGDMLRLTCDSGTAEIEAVIIRRRAVLHE